MDFYDPIATSVEETNSFMFNQSKGDIFHGFDPEAGTFEPMQNRMIFDQGQGELELPEPMLDLNLVDSSESSLSDPPTPNRYPHVPSVLPSVACVATNAAVTRPCSSNDVYNGLVPQRLAFPSFQNNGYETHSHGSYFPQFQNYQTNPFDGFHQQQPFGYQAHGGDLDFSHNLQQQPFVKQEPDFNLGLNGPNFTAVQQSFLSASVKQESDLGYNINELGLPSRPSQQARYFYDLDLYFMKQNTYDHPGYLTHDASDLDMNDRRLSEPYGMCGSVHWDSSVARVRENGMHQQMMDYYLRTKDGEPQRSHMAEAKLTRTHGTPSGCMIYEGPFSVLLNQSEHLARKATVAGNLAVTQPFELSTQFHQAYARQRTQHNMGQETSQIADPANLRQHVKVPKTQDDTAQGNGWTTVNGGSDSSDRQFLRESAPVRHTNRIKRKRLSKAEIDGGSPGENGTAKTTVAPSEQPHLRQAPIREQYQNTTAIRKSSPAIRNGLGIILPRKASTDSTSSVDSLLAPSHQAAPKTLGKNKDKTEAGHSDSESDVNSDALGLLQRVAAEESDDDDGASAAGAPARVKPIQPHPGPNNQGWRPHLPAVGTHYTIYSPHAPQPSYAPRPVPNDFDPNAPLSALEEAQLRDEGRFTKMEQSFLKDAIDEYCKKHTINVELANDYVCGKAREGNIPGDFWDEVCKALPQRTKNSIQRAAKRVFRNNQKKGPWTEEEEKALAEAYHKSPDQWARICEEVPGRSAEQCRDRWRNYTQNGVKLTRGPWTDIEEAQFIEICKQMLGDARLERETQRRQGRTVSEKFEPIDHLNFTAISSMMGGTRSRLHCRNKWHKLKKRPDVEEGIDAVMTGEMTVIAPVLAPLQAPLQEPLQAPTKVSLQEPLQASIQGQSVTSFPLPPLSGPHNYVQTPGTRPTYIPGLQQVPIPSSSASTPLLRTATPPTSLQPLASAGPHMSARPHTSQPPSVSVGSPAFHSFRPSPAPAFNQEHSTPLASAPPLMSRPTTASAPPQGYMAARPTMPSPLSVTPPVVSATAPPTIVPSTTTASSRPMPPSTASSSSSSPPSWVNAPPQVPRLFTPSPVSLSTPPLPALYHRATPGPKRVLPNSPVGLVAVPAPSPPTVPMAESPQPDLSMRGLTVASSASPIPTPAPTPAPAPAPVNSTTPPLVPEFAKSVSPLDSAPAKSTYPPSKSAIAILPVSSITILPIVKPALAQAQTNGRAPIVHKSASPVSIASPQTSEGITDDIADGRPVRKKQKTAKARGDD